MVLYKVFKEESWMGKKNESASDFWTSDDGLVLIEAWTRDGLTVEDICQKMGINRTTYYTWKREFPEFNQAVSVSKELVDYKVENALLKAALGFKTKEIKVTLGRKIFNGETVEMLKETTTKEFAPNVTACMAWLNNRKHDQWKRNRDKVMELDEEDNNISITIVRGPKGDENVNQEVNFRPKTKEEIKSEKEEQKRKQKQLEELEDLEYERMNNPEYEEEEDLSCWDDWDGEE